MNFIRDRLEPAPRTGAFWLRDQALFGATFLACVLVYGYPLTNFALHIDVETATVYGSVNQTFLLGRWGLSLVHRFILHEPVAPYFTIFLSLLFLTGAALATESIFNFRSPQRYAFTILYVSFPQFAYQLEFPNQSDCVAFGILCATFSFIVLQRFLLDADGSPAYARLPFSAALLVVATSFYDAIVFVPPVLCTLWCLQKTLHQTARPATIARAFGWCALLTIISYLITLFIGKAFQQALGLPRSSYLAGLVGWGRLPVYETIDWVAYYITADVFGRDYYGSELYLAGVAAAATLIMISVWRRFSAAGCAAVVALVIAALLAPFIIVALLGDHQEARTFLTQQIVVAGLIVMAFEMMDARAGPQAMIVAVLALVSCLHVSRLFFADTMAWTSDMLLGNRIVEAIYRVDPAFEEQTTPVYFHGAYAGPNIWRGKNYQVFGQSFFVWDGGIAIRIVAFLKASGIANLKRPTVAESQAAEPAVKAMPTWPNPNAVRLVNGVMVVRLGR